MTAAKGSFNNYLNQILPSFNHLPPLMFISFHFSIFVVVNEVTKIQKYYVIFCSSCKARRARKNKQTEHIVKKITQLKWPKFKKKWNEPNICGQLWTFYIIQCPLFTMTERGLFGCLPTSSCPRSCWMPPKPWNSSSFMLKPGRCLPQ